MIRVPFWLGTVYETGVLAQVHISRLAEKQLSRVPPGILRRFTAWVVALQTAGMEQVRLRRGLHDEPLLGKRKHQRSVRLSYHYRAIYEVKEGNNLQIVEVVEVSKHEY